MTEDKIQDIENQIQDVKNQVSRNIDKALERGENIDSLSDKSQNLENQSLIFRNESNRISRLERCRYYKNNIIVGIIVLIIFGIIIWLFSGK